MITYSARMQSGEVKWDGSTWMSTAWYNIREKKMTEIILPGSRNAATSALSRDVANDSQGIFIQKYRGIIGTYITDKISEQCNRYQPCSVLEQLKMGVRYIDLSVGFDSTKANPESPLRCCHGFFSTDIGTVLNDVSHFCLQNTLEFVILDFRRLIFNTGSNLLEECINLQLVNEIETRLSNMLVSSQLWHKKLQTLLLTGQRIFVFYPSNNNSISWYRDWMIPREFIYTMQPCETVDLFLKNRINLFVKLQNAKHLQILQNKLHPKIDSLFILQATSIKTKYSKFACFISSLLRYISGGHVVLCNLPDDIHTKSVSSNQNILNLIETKYNKAFLNVILLDFIDSSQIINRITQLNF